MSKKLANWPLHLMILPSLVLVLLFNYGPMAGIVIAFQKFIPAKGITGSEWIGWGNFKYVMSLPDTYKVLQNTVYIALMKIVTGLVFPLTIALLLNEIARKFVKRSIQTLIYLPHFLSWTILGGVLVDILSPSVGIVNEIVKMLGFEPIYFLGNNNWFPYVLVATNAWKEVGFSTILYLAALTSVNPALYEAAVVDGANRLRQTWHVSLPGMRPIIILLATLSLASVLNAGFDQVFVLYNPQVYASGDIIDTFVYRMGLISAQFGPATAIGLFNSIVSFILIAVAYYMAYRFAKYRIF
ncbi:ABC transporter permease [Cohnella abietis]|uniref:Sugar ABC transporter permease n=1 Tax=Cohnella abietis TaxID=2507935 RepID=A0A3T1DEF7_9BACL|nr:ABC transporter permease subunit [Cohnella abietis]BBI36541.1 sugar ABC transporter permease [Cohnella abietis]